MRTTSAQADVFIPLINANAFLALDDKITVGQNFVDSDRDAAIEPIALAAAALSVERVFRTQRYIHIGSDTAAKSRCCHIHLGRLV